MHGILRNTSSKRLRVHSVKTATEIHSLAFFTLRTIGFRLFVALEGAAEYSLGRKPQVASYVEKTKPQRGDPQWQSQRSVATPGYAVKDISTPWEGEAPAEPRGLATLDRHPRLGGSLALPSTRITNWVVLVQ